MGTEKMETYNFYHDKMYELVRSVGRLESGMRSIDNKLDKLILDNNKILDNHDDRIKILEAKTSEFEGAIKMLKLQMTALTAVMGVIALLAHVRHMFP